MFLPETLDDSFFWEGLCARKTRGCGSNFSDDDETNGKQYVVTTAVLYCINETEEVFTEHHVRPFVHHYLEWLIVVT